ncbi:hypothetical protein VNI00_014812 [Paramarasmius palmivorus]|uniref:Zn(2)-C6 fungal-type domain-containing protein n=1 Tax=Paramarasmius palmivorus TaxID=297713 RepID=A0AAW0BP57_9AGAR
MASPSKTITAKQKAQFKELYPKRDLNHASQWLKLNASKTCRACKASGTKCVMPEGGTATRCVPCGSSKRTPCSKTILERKARILAAMNLTHAEYDCLDEWYNESVLIPRAEARKEQRRNEKGPSSSQVNKNHKNNKNTRLSSERSTSPSNHPNHKRKPSASPEPHAKRIKTVVPESESEEEIVTRRRPQKNVTVEVPPVLQTSKKPRENLDSDQPTDHETDQDDITPNDAPMAEGLRGISPASVHSDTMPTRQTVTEHESLRSCKPTKQPRKLTLNWPSTPPNAQSNVRRPLSPPERRHPRKSARRSPSKSVTPPASIHSMPKRQAEYKTD